MLQQVLTGAGSLYTRHEMASPSSKAVQVRGSVSVLGKADVIISLRYLCLVVDGATSDANAVQKLTAMINHL